MLPHLVRLLPAAAASASQAADTLEFITAHTHHPHYPPFSSTGGGRRSSSFGVKGGEAAMLEAVSSTGDQGVLLQVRLVSNLPPPLSLPQTTSASSLNKEHVQ